MPDNDGFTIRLDYPIHPKPRYGHGLPSHPKLTAILDRGRPAYAETLRSFLPLTKALAQVPVTASIEDIGPHWNNSWFEGIDALSLYSFLATTNPKRYIEVGSGNSTKFARLAIKNHKLRTRITSIDPYPRAEINDLCDEIVRQPLEDIDLSIFDQLEAGDVLLVDNSHRVFTNSDATVVFLDVMPRLKPGVLLGIHDIMLPNDYPPGWNGRFYSEQYVLAAYLLAEGKLFDVALPCSYVGYCPEVKAVLDSVWQGIPGAQRSGSLFWIKMH